MGLYVYKIKINLLSIIYRILLIHILSILFFEKVLLVIKKIVIIFLILNKNFLKIDLIIF